MRRKVFHSPYCSNGHAEWASKNLSQIAHNEKKFLIIALFVVKFPAWITKTLKYSPYCKRTVSIPLTELASAVKLSSTPCWRRVQKLRDDGVIRQQVTLCDPGKLNLGVTVFVALKTGQHNDAWTKRFIGATRDMPEIVEIYRMSGDIDYLLKVVAPDIAGDDQVYKTLVKGGRFAGCQFQLCDGSAEEHDCAAARLCADQERVVCLSAKINGEPGPFPTRTSAVAADLLPAIGKLLLPR